MLVNPKFLAFLLLGLSLTSASCSPQKGLIDSSSDASKAGHYEGVVYLKRSGKEFILLFPGAYEGGLQESEKCISVSISSDVASRLNVESFYKKYEVIVEFVNYFDYARSDPIAVTIDSIRYTCNSDIIGFVASGRQSTGGDAG